jgi:DNA-binding CsgD family transcriptional regulator
MSTELARRELERLEVRHRALPRAWTAMALPRTRAIVLAAEGDLDGALDAIADADATQDTELPWELAWTLHLRGRLHRRRKEKLRAADSLGRARDLFVQLGARPWVARVDRDLARVGLRRGTGHDLTASEWAIARLAAKGLTTRAIAEAAFVSPKTVEANLTRIYRKLGIGSRAELGARMRDLETETHPLQT